MLSSWQKKFFDPPEAPPTEGFSNPTRDMEDRTASNVNHPDPKGPAEEVHSVATDTVPNEEAQDGVTQAEAITLTWTKTSLGAVYTL